MHLYIHIPFCISKCRYCGFYSSTDISNICLEHFAAFLHKEIELRHNGEFHPETIYIGGGTPSLLGANGLNALLNNPAFQYAREITIEVNPADAAPDFINAVKQNKVTRISIGAQSFDNSTLKALGRRHTVSDITATVRQFQNAGMTNISLDLIVAVPGHAGKTFFESIEKAVELNPTHFSVYPLSIEPGTPFEKDLESGKISPLSDEETMDIVSTASDLLNDYGYNRYEISNYSLPGFECRHNLGVWRGEDYTGIGPAAASRNGLIRRTNIHDVSSWTAAISSNKLPPAASEQLSEEENNLERFTTRLRLAEGVAPDASTPAGHSRLQVLKNLESHHIVTLLPSGAYTLTKRGKEVADSVMAEFMM